MKNSQFQQTQFVHFDHLSCFPEITHLASTRIGGYSKGCFSGLNLSYKTGDDVETVAQNYALLGSYLELEKKSIIIPNQTHSNRVGVVAKEGQCFENTDALVSNIKGLAIGILTADCVPILLYDCQKKVIATIHAGWRGTQAGIVANTIEVMKNHFGCKPEHIYAGVGPSIGRDAYEIGIDMAQEISSSVAYASEILSAHRNKEKAHLDLWRWNELQLVQNGILPQHIEISAICTYANADTFYSYRKQGSSSGRFISVIKLN